MTELRAPKRTEPHVNCTVCSRPCHPLGAVNKTVAALPQPECPDFVAVMVGAATWTCASCVRRATSLIAGGVRAGRRPGPPKLAQ